MLLTSPANAYVSGMKEDLDLGGDRLNYINAACNLITIQFIRLS